MQGYTKLTYAEARIALGDSQGQKKATARMLQRSGCRWLELHDNQPDANLPFGEAAPARQNEQAPFALA